jgi:hypothetical protein
VLCVVRYRPLRWADHTSRGVLPTVVRRRVWSGNLKNEEAMTRVGSQRHKKKKNCMFYDMFHILLSSDSLREPWNVYCIVLYLLSKLNLKQTPKLKITLAKLSTETVNIYIILPITC